MPLASCIDFPQNFLLFMRRQQTGFFRQNNTECFEIQDKILIFANLKHQNEWENLLPEKI